MTKLLFTFLLGMLTLRVLAQAVTTAQITQWRAQMRRALYIPKQLPAVEPQSLGSFSPAAGVVAERVSYRTMTGARVAAIVYRPAARPEAKMPGIVLVAGHGGDKSSWYVYYTGILYAEAGAVVVTYDPLGSGEGSDEHKQGSGEHDTIITEPASMPARVGGRMVADILQGVSYLAARKDVDAKRIAVLGFSMGSFHAALAGALDERIHAVLLTGGGDLDGPGGYWESSHAVMCQSGPYKALRFLGDVPAALFTMNARRGDTFIVNGTEDAVVDIPHHGPEFFDDLRRRVLLMNGSERGVFTTYFDAGASHRPNWMTRMDAAWLDQELRFANWPQQRLQSLPAETMREWAASVGYTLGKSSGREDRDAGLVMLEGGVPLLTPDQLNVLSMEAWQRQKAEFTYSGWVNRTIEEAHMQEAK